MFVAFTLLTAPVTATYAAQALSQEVEIRGYAGHCVDVRGPSTADGTAVQTWGCMNVPQQRWRFFDDGTIRSSASGKCLVLDEIRNGRDLVIRTCRPWRSGHKWIVHGFPQSGRAGVIRHSSGKCLDVEGPSEAYGTPVQVWDCVQALDNQTFVTVDTRSGSFDQRWHRASVVHENLCYSHSSCVRKFHLDLIHENLFWHAEYDHKTLGQHLTRLAQRNDLSTTEKIYIWNKQARETETKPDFAHNVVRNGGIKGDGTTYKHTVVTFNDGYHGYLVDFSTQDAFNMILDHETTWRNWLSGHFGFNKGDASASLRTVLAMQRFQATNNFAEFAEYWNALQRSDGENWCPERIYEHGCQQVGVDHSLMD